MMANRSKFLMRPVSLAPLTRYTVTLTRSRRAWFRKLSCTLGGCFSMGPLRVLALSRFRDRPSNAIEDPRGHARVVAAALEPLDFRLAPEPRHLPFGVSGRRQEREPSPPLDIH